MNSLATLPDSAPFAPEERLLLQDVIGRSSPEQRYWLSGFLAGWQASTPPVAALVAAPGPRQPLTILFATESGNAEALAQQARKNATRLGFAARLLDAADATPEKLAEAGTLLAIVSTWGEGDPPQRAIDLFAALAAESPNMAGLRFAVLALGDRAYAQFCATGRWLDERLQALGAERVAERLECDIDYESASTDWLRDTLATVASKQPAGAEVIPLPLAREAEGWSRSRPYSATIAEHVRLSGSRSSSDTWHIEVDLQGAGIAYEPGDALAVQPENDPALVEAVLAASGLAGDTELSEALRHRYDITTLTAPQVAAHAELTGDARLVGDETWRSGQQVLDLLEAAPHRLTAAQLTGLLRPLPSRSYSVASSRKMVGETAHLLVAALRYESQGRARLGVASVDIATRRRAGGQIKLFHKPNPHFRLPADPHRPVIMIGPGTGVAPFRGFLQERQALAAPGRNWLFFGHRNYTHDFLYQLDWQDMLKAGVLTRLDVAFSRDQPEKRYVQHALWDARRELHAWLADGAALYVCGDATSMARDVHATLLRILADQRGLDADGATAALDALRRDGRYLRDVY